MSRAISSSISSSRGSKSVDAGLSGNDALLESAAPISVSEVLGGCCEPSPAGGSCKPWISLSSACAVSLDPFNAFFAAPL